MKQVDSDSLPPAVFLMGPTAAGKTDLAVALVKRFPLAVVSVDSALVYRGMDVGTAKPDPATLKAVPHRLIDICDPRESYSAARFREDALREMADIGRSGRVPLLVGGTMLYFRTLQLGLATLPKADLKTRSELERELRELGLAQLHRRLRRVDPESAERIHPNDTQRTLRALEVFEVSGRTLSELRAEQIEVTFPYRRLKLVCAPESREVLHQRIERRFDAMLAGGFIAEVQGLLDQGVPTDSPALRAVGYRQVAMYLAGEYDRQTMRERAILATRQLAKRQMTWLRSEPSCQWIQPEFEDRAVQARRAVKRHLNSKINI